MAVRAMTLVDFNDGHPGPSNDHANRKVASVSRVGTYTTPGSTVDDELVWEVDRTFTGNDVDAIHCTLKLKVKTSYLTVGGANEEDSAVMWVRSMFPTTETMNDLAYLNTDGRRCEPQTGQLMNLFVPVILDIGQYDFGAGLVDAIGVEFGRQVTGADSQVEIVLYLDYGVIYA